jgi:hypothetical protein
MRVTAFFLCPSLSIQVNRSKIKKMPLLLV